MKKEVLLGGVSVIRCWTHHRIFFGFPAVIAERKFLEFLPLQTFHTNLEILPEFLSSGKKTMKQGKLLTLSSPGKNCQIKRQIN